MIHVIIRPAAAEHSLVHSQVLKRKRSAISSKWIIFLHDVHVFLGKHADIAEKSKNAYVPAHSFAGLCSPRKAVQLKEVFRQRPRVKAYALLPGPSPRILREGFPCLAHQEGSLNSPSPRKQNGRDQASLPSMLCFGFPKRESQGYSRQVFEFPQG